MMMPCSARLYRPLRPDGFGRRAAARYAEEDAIEQVGEIQL